MSDGASALASDEFATLMEPLVPRAPALRLAVAVSGGADSMALCLLAQEWAQGNGHGLIALTVDHGLRSDSPAEAEQVRRWLGARGIAHQVLRWEGPKPQSNLQARARAARYDLLTARCRAEDAAYLLIAHHLDDQAETLLMRLARGSGVDGLSAMPAIARRQGIRLLRPLLSIPRERLVATLQACGQEWIEDPSNQDARHDRSRLRAALQTLQEYPLLRKRLAATAHNMTRARLALEAQTQQAIRDCISFSEGGATLDLALWRPLPEEIALRVLVALLRRIGQQAHPPRLANLKRLYHELLSPQWNRTRSFGACLWQPASRKGPPLQLVVVPEAAHPPARAAVH